ncbi:MAG: potassium transporter KefB [Deltaproteobacteria bacterium RBG_16_47_11]|nr:MAG: potassium transporter KefB [Deltaproteobacteria bacterium RBG_16_47_11]
MKIILLQDILVIFGLSIGVLYVCHRLRVPTIIGFLVTGVLAGPYGLGLIKAIEAIETLAEVGVVLLLFTIGLEFSLKNFWQLGKSILLGATSQVLLTFFVVMIFFRLSHLAPSESIFLGFLLSLSSTAVVMKILQDRAEAESLHGRVTMGILIFQDLIAVPMMLLVPLLAGKEGNVTNALLLFSAEAVGIGLLIFVGSRWMIPWIFFKIAQTQIRELFALSVVALCLVIAWLTHEIGLSLALGAFLAGLIISESEYGHEALAHILPLRNVFASFFFVSIGMLLDLRFFLQQPVLILLASCGVLTLKTLIASFAAMFMGLPIRTTVAVGLGLCQIGEFSFILSKTGVESGLLPASHYQMFLAISIITMAVTPFLMAAAPALAQVLLRLPLPRKWKRGSYPLREVKRIHEKDHLIIIGFGLNGRNLARAARSSGIPYLIIESNPEVVREEKAKGEPIYFGDATQEAVLHFAKIPNARTLVVVINDPTATRRIISLARRLNSKIFIIVRTRYVREVEPLYSLGANEVIPEEFETSVEIFARVLGKYLLPHEEIEKFIAEVRTEGYEMFRSLSREATTCSVVEHCLPEVEVASFRVRPESFLVGKTLSQLAIRQKYDVSLVGIRRGQEIIYNPGAESKILENDLLILIGKREKIAQAGALFRP